MEDDIPGDTEVVLVLVGSGLEDIDREIIRGFLKYSEYELALDTLCEQLCERRAILTEDAAEKIMSLLARAEMDVNRYRAMMVSQAVVVSGNKSEGS